MNALLMSADPQVIARMQTLLEGTTVELAVVADYPAAAQRLSHWKFEAVMVDCQNLSQASELLRHVRHLPSSKETVVFAINPEGMRAHVFALGATFLLERSLATEHTRRTMRAGFGLMLRHRQRYFRHPLTLAAQVRLEEHGAVSATIVNLSESGAALMLPCDVTSKQKLELRFSLAGGGEVRTSARVIWYDGRGRAGVQFGRMHSGQEQLHQWLMERLHQHVQGAMTPQCVAPRREAQENPAEVAALA